MDTLKAGTRIECENGHHICTMAKDINKNGEAISPAHFSEWTQEPPADGQQFPLLCKQCGAPYSHIMQDPLTGAYLVQLHTRHEAPGQNTGSLVWWPKPAEPLTYKQIAADIRKAVETGQTDITKENVALMSAAARNSLVGPSIFHGGYYLISMFTIAALETNKVWNAGTPEEKILIETMVNTVMSSFAKTLQ